jgi:CheY-like chemotaxis protein
LTYDSGQGSFALSLLFAGEGRRLARKILLADDSVTAQNMGRKILIDAGYDVLTVNNGSAALKRIAESRPDLIVLDVYMPGYSGLEVCQRLKDSPETANIPVLLTVGKLEPFKPQEARRVKADAHIVKPFEASELLSAIARLEDGMVPSAEGSKFSSSAAGVERFSGYDGYAKTEADADPDTGWKTRLRFPAAKKKDKDKDKEKERPEAELDEIANYRDFRKGKGKPDPSIFAASSSAASAGAAKGSIPVPDIPRDITPEELDALSALAAKLDEPIPAAQSTPSLAEPATPRAEAVAVPVAVAPDAVVPDAVAQEAAAPDASKIADAVSVKTEEAVPASAAKMHAAAESKEEESKEFETPVASAEATDSAPIAGNEVEIPVAQIEPAIEAAVAEPPSQVEIPQVETQESEEVPVFAAVNTALLAEAPAPVDQQDEPVFAAAPAVVKMEAQPAQAEEPGIEAKAQETKTEETKTEETKFEVKSEVKAEETGTQEAASVETTSPVPVAVEKTVAGETPAPSDEELAEALRLLTPATVHSEASIPMPSPGTMVAVGQLLAEEAARNASAGTRWVAQSVGLTPEDAALSLEDEMFRTFASAPAGQIESEPAVDRASVIMAAVESRLAEVGMQVEPTPEEAPKAMAAAAAAVSSPAAPASEASASEATAIAGIVDRVLADLRPKIVEEIAKKLSGK